jgi:putative heme-binding domain-containing protein
MKRTFFGVVVFTVSFLALYSYVVAVLSGVAGEKERVEKERARFLKGAVEVSPEMGKKIFWGWGQCHTCHSIGTEGSAIRGPNLGELGPTGLPIALRAAQRAEERSNQTGKPYTPTDYLIESMVDPKAYLVESYTGIMPVIYKPPVALSLDEIKAVASYLQSTGGEVNVTTITNSPFLERVKIAATAPTSQGPTLFLEGNPETGKNLFFDLESPAGCGKCHTVGDQGGKVGPELTTISATQPLEYIIESIINPSAVIVSGYGSMLLKTKDGRFITGVVKKEDTDTIEIADTQGQIQKVRKAEVQEKVPQKISTMPGNFKEILTVQDFHDVLAFVQTLK